MRKIEKASRGGSFGRLVSVIAHIVTPRRFVANPIMQTRVMLLAASAFLPVAICSGQSPSLYMAPGIPVQSIGAVVGTQLTAAAGAPYAVYVDLDSGPTDLLGERFYLGLSPAFATFDGGIMPPVGVANQTAILPVFPGLAGLGVRSQAVVLDLTAPNGIFRVSNAASSLFYIGSAVIAETFDAASVVGYAGSFVSDVPGQIRGGAVTRRLVETIDPQGVPFPIPVASPLAPFGCTLTLPLQNDFFPQFELRVGHTDVHPDYTIDPWSALPSAPDSGLSESLLDNELPNAAPVTVYSGSYSISPSSLLPGNFVPYPMFSSFAYDGVSSLLLDFRVQPGLSQGINGMALRLMVQSSPLPGARVVATGTVTQPVLPNQVTLGVPDNAMPEFQIEFTRVQTQALSPWRSAFVVQPDYGSALVATTLPAGTSIDIEYRGSSNGTAATATAWSTTPDVADGLQFLQFRITFHSNPITGERPLIDSLVVPLQ
jgi:hypothetical protein